MNNSANIVDLKRSLTNRHIQLIALGGAIGTGLFLGSAGVLKSAGPSMILGYLIAGLIAFLMMRQLGEMIVEEPVAGSFSYFAKKYCGEYAGFLSGWNCSIMYILVGMAELTAVGKYVQFWWPEIPAWLTAMVFFALVNLINLLNVKAFGEAEFWFAIVKVSAIVGMILLGGYLLATAPPDSISKISNLWRYGGFFPNGTYGLVMAMPFIMFSFGGLEMLGFTAAEAKNPSVTIPKAINQVLNRVLLFYVGALSVLLALTPWSTLVDVLLKSADPYGSSPFVMVFSLLGSDVAANLLNFVVLTAAVSVYNSTVYCSSRQLLGMAEQGNAPSALKRLSKNRVPVNCVFWTAAATLASVALNYFLPAEALELLMALVVSALVLNWALISIIHLRFKRYLLNKGRKSTFPSIAHPLSNIAVLIFVAFIFLVMFMIPAVRVSVLLAPAWLVFLYIIHKFFVSKDKVRVAVS